MLSHGVVSLGGDVDLSLREKTVVEHIVFAGGPSPDRQTWIDLGQNRSVILGLSTNI